MKRIVFILLLVFSAPYNGMAGMVASASGSSVITIQEGVLRETPADSNLFWHYLDQSKMAVTDHDYIRADQLLDTAMMSAVSSGKQWQVALVDLQNAIVKKYLGDYDTSLDYYLKAIEFFERYHAWYYLTVAYIELAEFYRKTGKYDEGLSSLEEAHRSYGQGGLRDTLLMIRIYNRSAAIHNEHTDDLNVTIRESNRALQLAREVKDTNSIATSLNELGFTYHNLKKPDSSDYFYREAERLWTAVHNSYNVIHAMNNRAMMYSHNAYRKEEIIPLYQKIIHWSDSLDVDYPLTNTYLYLYINYAEQGDTGVALRYFDKHYNARLQEMYKMYDYNLHNVNEKYQNEKIKNKYEEIALELDLSNQDLSEKRKEQLYLLALVVFLALALIIIGVLLYKLRLSNGQLKEKNAEKDSLIQEIHHRVKNNLQFISSLVSMQLKTTVKPEDSKTLADASRRINAMALVHEMLYNQSENKGISIRRYLDELVDSFQDLINADEHRVKFELRIVDQDFSVADAIALGMITSELISNSLKHAFAEVEHPEVKITLDRLVPDEYLFRIADNGKGFDETPKNKTTLGLRLVDIFSRQLKGNYTISGTDGFEYRLRFIKK